LKDSTVYTKTPAGQQEILDRKLRLHPRLRTLLVLIDGRRNAGELIQTLSGVGVTGASLEELLQYGLIEARAPGRTPPEPTPDNGAETELANGAGQSDDELYSYFTPPA